MSEPEPPSTMACAIVSDGRAVSSSTYPGKLVEIEGAGRIGFRPVSQSGPPTIDVFVEGLGIREIKFVL